MPDNESKMFIRNADVFRQMLKRYRLQILGLYQMSGVQLK